MAYLRPVDPTAGRVSTYYAHTRRTTPSSEAGVDYYCPIGTPIRAADDGVIFERGGTLATATGRYITLDLNDGRRVRYLHLSRYANASRGTRVKRGDVIGYSGASGYGSEYFGATGLSGIPANTGGPHVHVTLWAGRFYQFGRYPLEPTLDFERYVGGSTAVSGATPFPGTQPIIEEEADMPLYIRNTARGDYAVQPGVVKHIANQNVLNILMAANPAAVKRVDVTDGNLDAVLGGIGGISPAEIAALPADGLWVSGQLTSNPTLDYGSSRPTQEVVLRSIDAKVDTLLGEDAAAEVESRLRDEFAAIPGAVRDEFKNRPLS
jgi:hypothetical protein